MNIGDVRTEVPTIYMKCGLEVTGPQKCQVVYIHPEGRFYRVRFTAANGTHFHECYFQQAQASEQDQPFKHGFHAAHRPGKGGALYG